MPQISFDRRNNIQWLQVIVELSIFLLLPPIIGLPLVICKVFQHKKNIGTTHYITFMVCIAAYFAAINATKMPGGDQWQYWAAYMNVPDIGFIKSLIP